MPSRLVILGRLIALAFLGDDMEHFGSLVVLDLAEDTHQVQYIVSICRTKIAEVESLEDIALLSGYQGLEVVGETEYAPLIVVINKVQLTCQSISPPTPTVVSIAGGDVQ